MIIIRTIIIAVIITMIIIIIIMIIYSTVCLTVNFNLFRRSDDILGPGTRVVVRYGKGKISKTYEAKVISYSDC